MQNFEHPRVPHFHSLCSRVHVSFMKSNVSDAGTNKQTDGGGANARSPPLNSALGCPECDNGIGWVLSHDRVGVASVVICDNVTCGRVVVLQSALVVGCQ